MIRTVACGCLLLGFIALVVWPVQAGATAFTRLTFQPTIHDESPAWSPDGSTIAFHSDSLPGGIWTIPATGGTATYVRSGSDPCWSPDGTQMAFTSGGEIWIGPAAGGAATQLTFMGPPTSQHDPAWSPDGSTIAFTSFDYYLETSSIWKIQASGGTPVLLHGPYSRHPSWSPDGTRIAFGDGILSGMHILHMAPDGSDAQDVTTGNVFHQSPSWSPDGNWIAFVLNPGGDADIWVVSPSGGVPIHVTSTPSPQAEYGPTWSPDSKKIAFSAGWWTPPGDYELWVASDLPVPPPVVPAMPVAGVLALVVTLGLLCISLLLVDLRRQGVRWN